MTGQQYIGTQILYEQMLQQEIDLAERTARQCARMGRMSPKRRLLVRLAASRSLGLRFRFDEQEWGIYLSLLPRWKRILLQLAVVGEHLMEVQMEFHRRWR